MMYQFINSDKTNIFFINEEFYSKMDKTGN